MSGAKTKRSVEDLQQWLVRWIAKELKVSEKTINIDEPFVNLGLTSRQAVVLSADLEDYVNMEIEPSIAWDHPTVERLAAHLASS